MASAITNAAKYHRTHERSGNARWLTLLSLSEQTRPRRGRGRRSRPRRSRFRARAGTARTGHDDEPRVVAARKKRDFRPIWLIAPTMVILAVVIVYPVLRAVYLSFQANKGIDPDTGRFTEGGFAGFKHYLQCLVQDCGGGAGTCPARHPRARLLVRCGCHDLFAVVTVAIECASVCGWQR